MTTTNPLEATITKAAWNDAPIPVAMPVGGPLLHAETAMLAIEDIVSDPKNPWHGADDDDGLDASIQTHGVLQPPRVRWVEDLQKWMITAGERRVGHALRAGCKTILCVIDRQPADPLRTHLERIAENLHRRTGHPVRLAKALHQLQELGGYSLAQLAQIIHKKDASFVFRKMSLLKFSPPIQDAIDATPPLLDESTAVEIAKLRDEAAREALARRAIDEKLTRDQVVAIIAARRQRRATPSARTRPVRRLLCRLAGGGTLAVTSPDGVPELTVEIVRDMLEFALQQTRKALRQQLPVAELAGYFQNLKPIPKTPADASSATTRKDQANGATHPATANGQAATSHPAPDQKGVPHGL